MKKIKCIGCGAEVEDIEGATHAYLGTSAGCWKLYGDVLAKEYGDSEYMQIHRLTVDAYSLQHLGVESAKTIQSMNLHLMALCAAFDFDIDYDFIPRVMNHRLREYKEKNVFQWLTPPSSLGKMTVLDVVGAKNSTEHSELVLVWAKDVWHTWERHHEEIKLLVKEVL